MIRSDQECSPPRSQSRVSFLRLCYWPLAIDILPFQEQDDEWIEWINLVSFEREITYFRKRNKFVQYCKSSSSIGTTMEIEVSTITSLVRREENQILIYLVQIQYYSMSLDSIWWFIHSLILKFIHPFTFMTDVLRPILVQYNTLHSTVHECGGKGRGGAPKSPRKISSFKL